MKAYDSAMFGRLGFGCSQLAGLSRQDRHRLLEQVLQHGITHFDVARSYGLGRAEVALGEFLRPHQGAVSVTTKAGIRPGSLARGILAKSVQRATPTGRGRSLTRRLESRPSRGHFSASEVESDLTRSLRALRVERVDVYLLHECCLADLSDELFSFLDERRGAGVIGAFGIGTSSSETGEIITRWPEFARVIQVKSSACAPPSLGSFGEAEQVFTHGAMSEASRIRARSLEDAAFRKGLQREFGIDPADLRSLTRLLLSYALQRVPRATVLFSTRSPAHVAEAAAALSAMTLDLEQLERLEDWLRDVQEASV